MHSALSSFLAGYDCVFVRKVGKETDEPVMVCDQGRLSICRENPVGNHMLFYLIHLWLVAGRKMLIQFHLSPARLLAFQG